MTRLNILITIVVLIISTSALGQKFEVTPNGLHDANDNTKTFLVINCEGKSAKELYENAIKYVNQNYKNPQEVLKGQIESEYFSFVTCSSNVITFRRSGGHPTYYLTYRTELNFKDGKVKYEIQDIKIKGVNGGQLFFSGNPFTTVAIFNLNGELKYAEAKTVVENYFNTEASKIKEFLMGSKIKENW
ncbi:MAG: DUF4468 domain-containing protein [Bacteroidales bacterium]|nr:DUF4468 domain-containing protein [Bacteroidales bacterium]